MSSPNGEIRADIGEMQSILTYLKNQEGPLEDSLHTITGQLTKLQGSFTGQTAVHYQGLMSEWLNTANKVTAAFSEINANLNQAIQALQQTDTDLSGLFRG